MTTTPEAVPAAPSVSVTPEVTTTAPDVSTFDAKNFKPDIKLGPDKARGPDGRFVAPEEPSIDPIAPEPTADPVSPEGEPAAVEGSAEAASSEEAPAPNLVKVEVPEGHPIRDRGKTELLVPADDEREIRRLLNDPVRRAELDAARNETFRYQAEAEEYKALAEIGWRKAEDMLVDSNLLEEIYEINALRGPEAARRYVRSVLFESESEVDKARTEARQRIDTLRSRDEGNRFAVAADRAMTSRYPELTQTERHRILSDYTTHVHNGSIPRLHAETLFEYADRVYSSHPRVLEQRAAKAEEARKADEAKKAEEARLAEARKQANPLGRMPSPGTTTGAPVPDAVTNMMEHRKRLANGKAISLGR